MDQNTVINSLYSFQKGNHRRFLDSQYADQLWIGRQAFHRIINKTNTMNWFDIGAMQSPVDLMTYMECIMTTKPRVIIETGTAGGGGTLFYSELLKRIHGPGNYRIITIELHPELIGHDFNSLNSKNKYLEIISIIGSSTDSSIVDKVYKFARDVSGPVMVTLDSDHSAEHVAKELGAYADIVDIGQYLIVQDTYLGLLWGGNVEINSPDAPFDYKGSPLGAVEAFLSVDNRYEIDTYPQRWILTQCPFGFLKRVK